MASLKYAVLRQYDRLYKRVCQPRAGGAETHQEHIKVTLMPGGLKLTNYEIEPDRRPDVLRQLYNQQSQMGPARRSSFQKDQIRLKTQSSQTKR